MVMNACKIFCTRHETVTPNWSFNTRFLTLSTTDMLTCVILCFGGCAAHLRLLSHVSDLYSLDASSTAPLPSHNNQNSLQTLPSVPWGQIAIVELKRGMSES